MDLSELSVADLLKAAGDKAKQSDDDQLSEEEMLILLDKGSAAYRDAKGGDAVINMGTPLLTIKQYWLSA